MAVSSSLFSSIPMVSPTAKVAPSFMAASGAKVAPVSKVAPLARFAPIARFAPVASVKVATPSSSELVLPLSRSSFPNGFIFGAATAAYQIEGGIDSRGLSVWDEFTHKYPEKITDRSNGDVACDSYNLYMKDIELVNELGLDAYRFSISWSRILPTGKLSGGINEKGIKYYNDLIDAIIVSGKIPFVTLYHVDRPQPLEEDGTKGFLDSHMIHDFKDFADVCFAKFGDKVKYWMTLNEPLTYCDLGYTRGTMAPARCSCWQKLDCLGGDSSTEPYTVAHNLLLAHAAAVDLYNTKYKTKQNGQIGITLNSAWYVPMSDKDKDKEAASRAMDFELGWFLEPLKSGKYPEIMQELVGDRLPTFNKEESNALKGSYDFLGLNYYTSQFAADLPVITTPPSRLTDPRVEYSNFRCGSTIPIGDECASGMYIYPQGLGYLLRHIKDKYDNPIIYITENGMADHNFPCLSIEEACMDIRRVDYYFRHLYNIRSAIKDGVNLKGYFAWSLLDNFEWALGYTLRYGLHYVDFNTLERYQKYSAKWFQQFLSK